MGELLDNYDMFEQHDRERERELRKFPKCDCCGEPITDEHLYHIGYYFYCEACVNEEFRERTEDYMEE
jgi:RNA polymerase-binding transcription factor DksA